MAEYGSMFLVSGLASVLFLGGWNGPVPVAAILGLSDGTGDTAPFLVRLIGCANLLGKATLGVLVMMWVRWTLPRLRIDQVMTTCLKYCTPLAAVMFAGAMLWAWAAPGGIVGLVAAARAPRAVFRPGGEIREGWVVGPGGLSAPDESGPVATPAGAVGVGFGGPSEPRLVSRNRSFQAAAAGEAAP